MRNVDVRPAAIEGDAAALYIGDVMHARLKPVGHRFSYRVMSLLIDLDRLEVADRQTPLFGVNRRALYSFHEADHGDRGDADRNGCRVHRRQGRRPGHAQPHPQRAVGPQQETRYRCTPPRFNGSINSFSSFRRLI